MKAEAQSKGPSVAGWRVWVLASRPRTLTAALTPVAVGSALAYAAGSFRLSAALAALLAALLIQVGTNLHNDVADFERGADAGDRLGPLRVTQAGLLSPRQVRAGALAAFAAAGAAGLYLTWLVGWPVLIIGLASIAAGLAYTAGPWPLAYNGLGDLFVMLFFGFVAVGGTAYVQVGSVPPAAWPAALAVGSTITALLVVNNVRDVESDRRAGRRTIPVVFGRNVGVAEYALLLAVAYLAPFLLIAFGLAAPWVLLPLLTVPLAVRQVRTLGRERGRALNAVLAGTSKLVLWHGLLLAVGLAVGGVPSL